jgi:Ca2+/Na+ antiporter
MAGLQELIHKLEVGEGTRYMKIAAAFLVLMAVTVVFHLRETRNFATQEAMDSAQLARRIATKQGYTTDFVRPLSMHLLSERNQVTHARAKDGSMIRVPHPDIANPPLYPLVLAGAMKVLPFKYDMSRTDSLRFQPEIMIDFVNQALFFVAAFLLYRLAARMFDTQVALLSVVIFLGANVFWQFAVSGLSTMLVIVLLLALAWVLVVTDQASQPPEPVETPGGEPVTPPAPRGFAWFAGMAALAGVLVASAALTRYSAGWLILPVLAFFGIYQAGRRIPMCLAALLAFSVVMAPWLVRNYQLSGHAFGTAEFAVLSGTHVFPGDRLERSLNPNFDKVDFFEVLRKLLVNTADMLEKDFPRLGGSWAIAFFLVGLMIPFRNRTLNRFRLFVCASLVVLAVAQAVGQTQLIQEENGINTENLLVLAAPFIFVFGVAMYFILLDQLPLPFPEARQFINAIFILVACAPFLITLLPPKAYPMVYPPYWPPLLQTVGSWTETNDMVMSDIPWATAWYGNRQSVWAVLDVERDFYAINDFQKPVKLLHLSQLTTDAKFYSQMVKGYEKQEKTWEWFLLQSRFTTNVSPGFPLKRELGGFMDYGQLILSDQAIWMNHKQ